MQTITPSIPATDTGSDPDFDLDVSIVESGPSLSELMRSTDNGCGSTRQSACVGC